MELRDGYSVVAQALGVDETVLRAVLEAWAHDPAKAPMLLDEFTKRLTDAQAIAQRLNNTNAWELAIRGALAPEDVPATLPTVGTPRLATDASDNELDSTK